MTIHPAVQKSLDHVRSEIESGAWSQGDRLPPIRVLARQAHVSAAAMCEALGVLRTENVVSIIKNRGAYLGRPPADGRTGFQASPPGESQRWQRLKIQIEKDIFNVTLMGEKGGAVWDTSQIFTDHGHYQMNMTPGWLGKWDVFEYKMKHFVEVCRDGRPNECPPEHAVMVQKMLDAIYQSAAAGKEVVIE